MARSFRTPSRDSKARRSFNAKRIRRARLLSRILARKARILGEV